MNIIKSFKYAFQGILYCISTQRNFRFHIVAAISVYLMSLFYQFDRLEMICIFFTIILVLVCEMINTSIENAIDIQCNEYNINAKVAKDVAAGAVLISAIMAVIVAFVLFFDIQVILCILDFFIQRPYLWLIVIIYVLVAVYFVVGIPFKHHTRKGDTNE